MLVFFFFFFGSLLATRLKFISGEWRFPRANRGNDWFDGNGGARGRGLGYGFCRWWQEAVVMGWSKVITVDFVQFE